MSKKHTGVPWGWVVAVVAASLLVLWPLFHPGFFVSDDGGWMIIRLSAFYQSLSSGQFPVRFIGRLNNSYGYPVSNFLYPGFLYIGSLLHLAGISFPNAVKVILGVSVAGSAVGIFFALRRRFGAQNSFVGAMSFLFAPYVLYDMYHRGSVGEILAMLPAAVLMLSLSTGLHWPMPLAYAFLIVSHNTTALLFGSAFGVILLTQPKPARYIWHMALGIGLSAFFWAPAIFEQSLVQFQNVTVSDPSQYFITLPQAVLLGIPTLLCVALALGLKSKHRMFDMTLIVLIALGYALALPVSAVLWQMPVLSKLVQFPYRFLVLPVLLGPWVVSRTAEALSGRKRVLFLLILAALWIIPVMSAEKSITFVQQPLGYYTTNEGTTTVANEYMPRWVSEISKQRTLDTIDVISGDANLSMRIFPKEAIKTTAWVKETSVLQINKLYYPGWGVTIDGVLTPIDHQNPFGFMRITVPPGVHQIVAVFRETPERFMADIVSVVSLIVYGIVLKRLAA